MCEKKSSSCERNLSHIKKCNLITVCMYCGSERQRTRVWRHVARKATLHHKHTSHGVCPGCYVDAFASLIQDMNSEIAATC